MIFGTWMSYFLSCQILENKVRSPVSKKKDWVEGSFTFSYVSTIFHKKSSQYWVVKDGVSCISYWQAGLGLVQCCNIVPSLVPSVGKNWESGFYFAPKLPRGFDHFVGRAGVGNPPSPRGRATSRPSLYFWSLIWILSSSVFFRKSRGTPWRICISTTGI